MPAPRPSRDRDVLFSVGDDLETAFAGDDYQRSTDALLTDESLELNTVRPTAPPHYRPSLTLSTSYPDTNDREATKSPTTPHGKTELSETVVSLLGHSKRGGGGGSGGGGGDEEEEDDLDDAAAAEALPEMEFMNLLMHSGAEEVQDLVRRRVDYLRSHDDAAQIQRMPFWKISIWRSPAIIATLTFEMFVGGIIAAYNPIIEKHILLSSFFPILSSMSGNIGLQASTTTLRALATGHASKSDINSLLRVIAKECASAAVIGFASFVILSIISGIWSNSWTFAAVTGFST
ncbi:hypothetical protein HDV00_003011 [Rhizophlyctis rosea]|nr:hypothetical protein HDV00_003011 [Rhizophlyctis rosea]